MIISFAWEIEHLMTSRDLIEGDIIVVIIVITIELSKFRKDHKDEATTIELNSQHGFRVNWSVRYFDDLQLNVSSLIIRRVVEWIVLCRRSP